MFYKWRICLVLTSSFIYSFCFPIMPSTHINSSTESSVFVEHSDDDLIEFVPAPIASLTNTIMIYSNESMKAKDALRKDVENLMKDAGNRLNSTISNYINFMSNIGDLLSNTVGSGNEGKREPKYIPDMYLDTINLIVKNGYDAESHTVETDDGYLLTLHRIPHRKAEPTGSSGRQAVFLQHGLLSSSADFITSGPKKALAYVLAEAGYDVWMGNFRGNTYSRAHAVLSIKDSAFWDFTFHEMAMFDLPAMIDYVNKMKNSEGEMLYIGHSMGNTALYALLSMRPEYNKKLKAALSMAPVAFMSSLKSPFRFLAPYADSVEWITKFFGADEFLPQSAILKWLALSCKSNYYEEKICQNVLFLISGFDEAQFDSENFPVVLSHTPAGASTKTLIHFAQEIRDGGVFQQFDYGTDGNKLHYGQGTPPEYPIDQISLPIALFYGDNDWLAGIPDVEKLNRKLPNSVEFYEVPFAEFNHFDFLWAVDAQTLVYNEMLRVMRKYEVNNMLNWNMPSFLKFKWTTISA